MSREWAVPLTVGKGNAVLPPACNFQPQRCIVIFNLHLSEHKGLVLPLCSSLLTHYLSCLKGERKQEVALKSLQDCFTDFNKLGTSLSLIPQGSMIHDPGEGQSILPSELQLLLTCVCKQPGQHMVWEGWGTPRKGGFSSQGVERKEFPHMSKNNVWERWRMLQPPGDPLATLQSVNILTFPRLFSKIHCSAFQSNSRCPEHGAKSVKIPAATGDWYAQCKDMRARCDTGMAKYSWLKTYFFRLN